MLTTSLYKEFKNVIISKGDNMFYNSNSSYVKRQISINKIMNILNLHGLLNKNGLDVVRNIKSYSFEEWLVNKMFEYFPKELNMEVINDESTHVSSLSESIIMFHKVDNIIEPFLKSRYDCNLIEEDEDGVFRDVKAAIIDFKKSGDDYTLLMGHFFENLVSTLMTEQLTNQRIDDSILIKQVHIPHESIKCFDEYPNKLYILRALNATIEEVCDKNKSMTNNLQLFINDFLANNNMITDVFDKYVNYLSKQVAIMLKSLAYISKKFSLITKHHVDFRKVYGEIDYILRYDPDNAILCDCKMYKHIDDKAINKFYFQLLGYYHQHNCLKTLPGYKRLNNFDIKYFLIINPLDNDLKFSYYILPLNECETSLAYSLDIWENYIDKCLSCYKSHED